jgi:hypothetical protein
MPRKLGIVQTAIWVDEDFRALTADAQRAYILFLSQPKITNCGVIAYLPRKLARLAADDSPTRLERAVDELAAARFVIVDRDTDELLVRTFVRHDKIESQPKLKAAAIDEFREVESLQIRRILREENPGLFDDIRDPRPLNQPILEGLTEPLAEGVSQGVDEGVSEPLRVRARAAPAPAVAPAPSPAAADLKSTSSRTGTTPREPDKTEQPAAALAEAEAPRESRVAQVVDELRGTDPGTLNQILPLATQLSAEAFEQVVERISQRRDVANPAGLLRWFLEQEIGQQVRDQTATIRGAPSIFIPAEPPPDLEDFVRAMRRWTLDDLNHAFDKWGIDEDERIRLGDVVADARSAGQKRAGETVG